MSLPLPAGTTGLGGREAGGGGSEEGRCVPASWTRDAGLLGRENEFVVEPSDVGRDSAP